MSAAIPIRAPGSQAPSAQSSPTPRASQLPANTTNADNLNAKGKSESLHGDDKKLCRNIVIFGSCKYQDRGCAFSHDVPSAPDASMNNTSNTATTSLSTTSAANAPVFVPSFGGGSGTSVAGNANAAATSSSTNQAAAAASSSTLNSFGGAAAVQEFIPRREATPVSNEDAAFFEPGARSDTGINGRGGYAVGQGQQHHAGDMVPQDMADYYNQAMDLNGTSDSPGGMYDYGGAQNSDPFFAGQMNHFVRQPLQYHLYHPLPSSTIPHGTPSFFLPPSTHINLTQKAEATHATPSVDMKLPEDVGGYTGLMPLDKAPANGGPGSGEGSSWAGFRGWLFKAWKESDGQVYVLRRIEGFRLQHEAAIASVEKWARIRHPGIVSVREAFTTRAFGDQSIIFVYDYHPLSSTLYESHLSPMAAMPPNPWANPAHLSHHRHPPHFQAHSHSQTPLASPLRPRLPTGAPSGGPHSTASTATASTTSASTSLGVPERILWSYIVQLASALKAVHNSGLAVRNFDPNRIIVTGKNRVRIAGCAVMDVLGWDGGMQHAGYQHDDLLAFGKLVVALACGSNTAIHNLPKSIDHIARTCSPDLKNFVLYLLSKPGPRKTIDEALSLMGSRVVEELNASLVAEDSLESELMRELENGRLVRLLAKFGFINERPEFDHDPRWAETGDRYLIKLFRDFVFHQVDENGRPVTDLSHVITCLNKLDAGIDEKIMLVSRDEQSCLIVSYREIKNCIEGAFLDLSR
ncbi:PAB-dependent poly(A)-specific ribonuclease subunit 3 [Microbotryomycetes sp. JL221]|nr:PAB-dependent poly(A)-specific ribonuclease subunit 3 [Microbotryomycetes sp. JL221]